MVQAYRAVHQEASATSPRPPLFLVALNKEKAMVDKVTAKKSSSHEVHIRRVKLPHIVRYRATSRVPPGSKQSTYRSASGQIRAARTRRYDAKQ
ncbi:hypothetical protein B296_00030259 [Ensete ventricosum]|uniref:Uncharacterized protein n=1 Tax=Ensete ventricosum TaxID=4639 RepID=A0A427AJ78_ENSVE|nr:hypothetical protein B296_00030259 [Ensete ventricosum]